LINIYLHFSSYCVAKIKYPPEPEPSESERSNIDRANTNGAIVANNSNNINSRMIKHPELHHNIDQHDADLAKIIPHV
jgi:hypothetical protein